MYGLSGGNYYVFSFHIRSEVVLSSRIFLDIHITVKIFSNGYLLTSIKEGDI